MGGCLGKKDDLFPKVKRSRPLLSHRFRNRYHNRTYQRNTHISYNTSVLSDGQKAYAVRMSKYGFRASS